MELLIGFFLGVLSSVLAGLLLNWVTTAFPQTRKRALVVLLSNPSLHLRLTTQTAESAVAARIRALFESYCQVLWIGRS